MALPNFSLGRQVGALTVCGLVASVTGNAIVLTTTAAGSILAQFLTIDINQQNETENISASSRRSKNMVIVETGADVEFTGLLFGNDVASSSSTNPIKYIAQNYDYVQWIATYAGLTWTGQSIVKSYRENTPGKGRQEWTFSLEQIDNNSTNPSLA